MPQWSNSTRRDRLPTDWQRIRQRILRRDKYRCQVPGCGRYANEVDHIRPGDDHSDSNLRAICTPHHRSKSSSEGGFARAQQRRQVHMKYRRAEDHFPTL